MSPKPLSALGSYLAPSTKVARLIGPTVTLSSLCRRSTFWHAATGRRTLNKTVFESGASTNSATGAWGEDNSGRVCGVNAEMPLSKGRQHGADGLGAQLPPRAVALLDRVSLALNQTGQHRSARDGSFRAKPA